VIDFFPTADLRKNFTLGFSSGLNWILKNGRLAPFSGSFNWRLQASLAAGKIKLANRRTP